ncbi:MAG: hypothetical protein K2L51_05390, partial [Clostridiales bacterium]|nr:hypothetical protein [Clostridiales bacterium]
MKVLRAIFSVIVAAALVIGGVYVYRSCGSLSCAGSLVAYADTADDGVLLDLQKDPNFKISDYSYIENDTSLHVIQIAENAKGGLYVYVYHPGGIEDKKVLALHVNMCTTYIENKPSSYNFYALTPDKGEKTIYRYTVDGFTAKGDPVRHYDIASITRSFIAGVDEEPGGDNTITEKAYPVGQAWTVAGIGNLVQYSMVTRDVVDIASKYVASIRYYSPDVHNHIIAFTADRTLDELYEAEIIYTKQDLTTNNVSGIVISAGAQIDVTDVIVADHKETVVTPNGNKTVYSWDKIQSASAFCTAEKEVLDASVPRYSFNKDIRENVLKHDWVIRFLTTSY